MGKIPAASVHDEQYAVLTAYDDDIVGMTISCSAIMGFEAYSKAADYLSDIYYGDAGFAVVMLAPSGEVIRVEPTLSIWSDLPERRPTHPTFSAALAALIRAFRRGNVLTAMACNSEGRWECTDA